MLVDKGGETIEARRASIAAGARQFTATLRPAGGLPAGEYTVSARARGRGVNPGATTASMVVFVHDAPRATSAVMIRRGPTTGNRETPTADVRFRRTDQLRVEVPAPGPEPPAARLLDRNGTPLPLPVTAAVRDDPDGSRWLTAHVVLAPLAPGDYVIELQGRERTLVGIRIVP
jgi:hypothetical protein